MQSKISKEIRTEQLEQLRQDFLSLVDADNLQIDIYTKKNLMKGIINNFFDYLKDLQVQN
ncbi:MAG: hypothetical protein PHE78_00500 [Candidatus Gastranaerophilales bacterium]|nr:hypothetical protein [Candidatus Gastranaerophilales bacterium]